MISYNNNWVYRNIHGYDILVNKNDNNILSISPILGELFFALEKVQGGIDTYIEEWKDRNNINNDLSSTIDYFLKKEVFIHEE